MLAAVVLALAAGVTDSRTMRTAVYAATIPVGFLYAPLLMARPGPRNGQTLGKQWLGIRVVRVDGAHMTFWTGVLRTVVAQQLLIAVTFYVYAFVDYLWPLRDPQNQALHDKIAKTWVLSATARTTAEEPPAPPPAWPSSEPPPDETPTASGWLPPRAPGG